MTFDPVTEEQRQEFFHQGYAAHLPGYTGHCPTLKFRVGKRYGACTEEITKDLLEKKILKTGPYMPSSRKENLIPNLREKDIRRDWKKNALNCKSQPYILGYTGYIPGFNNIYGLTFMKAVDEGAIEWRETQNKLKARRDAMRAHVERTDPRNLQSRVRTDNVDVEIDHGHMSRKRQYHFDNRVTPENPPIVGYTGHIPGAKGEVALSKRYAQAARKGLELLQKKRESWLGSEKDSDAVQRVLDQAYIDETGHIRA